MNNTIKEIETKIDKKEKLCAQGLQTFAEGRPSIPDKSRTESSE